MMTRRRLFGAHASACRPWSCVLLFRLAFAIVPILCCSCADQTVRRVSLTCARLLTVQGVQSTRSLPDSSSTDLHHYLGSPVRHSCFVAVRSVVVSCASSRC